MRRLMRYASIRSFILPLSTSLTYSIHLSKPPLLNDSITDRPRLKTKTLIAGKKRTEPGRESDSFANPSSDIGVVSATSVADLGAEEHVPLAENDESTAWTSFSSILAMASDSINSIPWSALGDRITDYIIPDWASDLPNQIARLQREMEMSPGSLADEIWQEAHDQDINPEIAVMARVRIGKDLCPEEKEFKTRRKRHTRRALARYLDMAENDIDPEDVPTIAMCGSGGGLRAMVAGCGSYLSAQEAGLLDCVTYTAGVSGSCWLQTLYYSSISNQKHQKIVDHLKWRIGTHIAFPPDALELLTTAPTNKFLLSGFVEKLKGDSNADFGLVDIYGLLLATRLLVPRGELGVDDRNLKISNQRTYLSDGENPLPIYTAVRHEIPIEEQKSEDEGAQGIISDSTKEKAKQEAWFQWFEFTPYELFCDELDAGIPSWGVGRKYENGCSIPGEAGLYLPEYRMPLMMGIWGSAFCATLAHYYKEIRPIVKGVIGFGGVDDLITERNDDLAELHPIEPSSIPNYALGLRDRLPKTCPKSIFNSEHLQLADAGMSNNLPLYPLLREGREVEILIAFDSSADIKTENWLSVADGYARQRGIKGWPMGAGWPKEETSKEDISKELEVAEAKTTQEAAGKIAAAREVQRMAENATQETLDKNKHEEGYKAELGYCNVWVGTTMERQSESEPPQSKLVNPDADWELLSPDAGIAVVYFPLLQNAKVKDIDPNTTDFLSTWNFVYSRDNIDKVVDLARANFEEGKDQTKRAHSIMALTYEEFEEIWDWVPSPGLLCPREPREPPPREEFKMFGGAGSPTPSESLTEVFWARHVLTSLPRDQLVEVASGHLISLVPRAISARKGTSQDLVKGFLSRLFGFGHPFKLFAAAAFVLCCVPRTEAFKEEWRLMCPDHPELDEFDADDPEGLATPSITGSKHLVPSYFRPAPRTPGHLAELLIISALGIATINVGPIPRDLEYWTLNVAAGLWSQEQLIAADGALTESLKAATLDQEKLRLVADEMERRARRMGAWGVGRV